MKASWPTKPLGEVATFERGLTYSKADEVAHSRNRVLRANNIDLATKSLDLTDIRYIANTVQVPPAKKVRKGSLLICTASGSRSHLGKVALIDDDYDFAFGGFMGLITAGPVIDSRFLYYRLTSEAYQEKLDSLASGTNINNMKFKDLADFPIPLPPLEDQRRIVAVLDKAFAAIATATANAEKNLANARELLSRALSSVFEGDGVRIGDQIELQRGFDITKKDQRSGTVPVVSSSGIKSRHSNAMAKGPGVVIGRKGTLGSAFYIDEDYWPHDTTLWVKDFKGNNPRLVYYLFRYLDVKQLDSGTANPSLNRNLVHNLKIGWPQLARQAAIVANLDELEEVIGLLQKRYEQKIELLATLKKALLRRAFTRELTASMPETIAA